MKQNQFYPCPRCDGSGKLPHGGHLRGLREGRGLTLKEMAKRLRVSDQYLSDIERGRRTATPIIAKGYGV